MPKGKDKEFAPSESELYILDLITKVDDKVEALAIKTKSLEEILEVYGLRPKENV